MRVQPVINCQQDRQNFGAFTHKQSLTELAPLLKRALNERIVLSSPAEIVESIRETGRFKSDAVFTKDDEKILLETIKGCLFTMAENVRLCHIMQNEGFIKTLEEARKYVAGAMPLPLKTIRKSTEILEEVKRGYHKNNRVKKEAELRIEIANNNINNFEAQENEQRKILEAYGLEE